jgi:hypothetical protein
MFLLVVLILLIVHLLKQSGNTITHAYSGNIATQYESADNTVKIIIGEETNTYIILKKDIPIIIYYFRKKKMLK